MKKKKLSQVNCKRVLKSHDKARNEYAIKMWNSTDPKWRKNLAESLKKTTDKELEQNEND